MNERCGNSMIGGFVQTGSLLLTSISIFLAVVLIAMTALQWVLIDYFTPFCIGPLLLAMWGMVAALILVSIICLPSRIRGSWKQAILPLVINIGTLAIVHFVPFTSIWLELEFRVNWSDYNEVVKLVEDGEIQPNERGLVLLPPEYRHLSKGGGEVIIDTSGGVTRVFFFTFRGVLDNFSGYMYRSDDNPPRREGFWGDWKQIVQKRPHWFFCASY